MCVPGATPPRAVAEESSALPRHMTEPVMRFDRGRTIRRDDIATRQIDQMRQHRTTRRATQCRVEPDIETFDHSVDCLNARFEAIDDSRFTFSAMRDKGADMALRFGDRRPMGRPIDRVAAP